MFAQGEHYCPLVATAKCSHEERHCPGKQLLSSSFQNQNCVQEAQKGGLTFLKSHSWRVVRRARRRWVSKLADHLILGQGSSKLSHWVHSHSHTGCPSLPPVCLTSWPVNLKLCFATVQGIKSRPLSCYQSVRPLELYRPAFG